MLLLNHTLRDGVIYPVVPQGTILFRLVVTANHTNKDIDQTLDAFDKVTNKLNSGFYKEPLMTV